MRSSYDGAERRAVARCEGQGLQTTTDLVAIEEPLEIRVAGEPLAITMRTPGEDRALAVGFLYGEGIVSSREDLGRVHHCGRPDDEGYGNVIDALPGPGVVLDVGRLEGSRRGTLTTSACGVCGRRSIDDLLERIPKAMEGTAVTIERVLAAPGMLREHQPRFADTGGVHAALAIAEDGRALHAAEDVGRHNAVDKVVGHMLLAGTLMTAELLVVSGRSSFEIVQKAAMARIPLVVAVGASSTLAVDLAERAGITLVGFVRENGFIAYTHGERIGA